MSAVDKQLNANDEIPRSSDRSFGIVFFVFFLLLGLWPILTGAGINWWLLVVAVTFLLLAVVYPKSLAPLNYLWFRFGLLLHKIVSPVILSIVFFVAVVPIGLIMRMLGKDVLNLKLEKSRTSYWISRKNSDNPKESLKNQF